MRKRSSEISIIFGEFTVLNPAGILFAATGNSTITASQQLASQAEKFREEQKRTSLELEEKPLIIQEKKGASLEKIEGPRFTVKTIKLDGNTIFPTTTFEKFIVPFQNKETSFEELLDVAGKITDVYIAAGYSTCQAFIAPQKVADGHVTIQVMEGKAGVRGYPENKLLHA